MENESDILHALRSKESKRREWAESEIYNHFKVQVYAILSRIVVPNADLDDAVQEAFIDVFRGIAKFEGRSGLGTWIYRVALRRGWKYAAKRKATRKKEIENLSLVENTSGQISNTDLKTREMAKRLEEAMKKLNYEQRSIIALSGLEGLTPTEIAKTMGVPVGTVHSRLSRARAKLKSFLNLE